MRDVAPEPGVGARPGSTAPFTVRLTNFEGPFDLLLQLITQRRMDVTEVALHQVTDDFIAHTRLLGERAGLEETTEFLVVAATLLDLKTARLLPAGDVENAEDLALLEARDLIFARLLQYRAYKQVAAMFAELERAALRRYPRSVALEDRFSALLPEVLLGVDPQRFAEVAAAVFRPAPPPPEVSLAHLHTPQVSVPEQAALLLERLRAAGGQRWTAFGELVADCESTVQVVARFLALLELYREAAVIFDQDEALGPLLVQWSGQAVVTVDELGEDYG
ncbi:segregation/condensation protein A [Rhodococcus sp. X156]|uniref:segregation and condensation protein A n=1 Tax=Rhodococcus sp. X156 TaxID=2499145 RepID=UPI001F497A6A|nr:segregation/condensation protein A [Rhodococcus sp. X156]